MRYLLALLALTRACAARQAGFSIHEDILAHPQFEVVFSESYILEHDAQILLDRINQREKPAAPDTDVTAQRVLGNPARRTPRDTNAPQPLSPLPPAVDDGQDGRGDGSAQVSETFEVMNFPPSRYLCSVPVLAPPSAPNQTATDLAKAEEARELSQASVRGTEIISRMEGECMYYMSGWWSYSFCYGKEIVQFHALHTKAGRPVKDPHSLEFVLGRMQIEAGEGARENQRQRKTQAKEDPVDVQKHTADNDPHKTELQVKGDQRFMVQHIGAGTICDLTGRERTIEIQYHCNPGGTSDRIGWIKEVTTCAYLMEIRTPRLCEEAAFMPPKPARAHPISCRAIVSPEEAATWHNTHNAIESHEAVDEDVAEGKNEEKTKGGKKETGPTDFTVGGVVVGARETLGSGKDGQPSIKLEPPRGYGAAPGGAAVQANDAKVVKVVAKAEAERDGGKVEVLPKDELMKLDLNPAVIDELCEKMHKIAAGRAWMLEAVEVPGQAHLELRATLDQAADGGVQGEDHANAGQDAGQDAGRADQGAANQGQEKQPDTPDTPGDSEAPQEGSEETFKKDEL